MTIIERKQLAAHQRRVGPNTVGTYGVLQPFVTNSIGERQHFARNDWKQNYKLETHIAYQYMQM